MTTILLICPGHGLAAFKLLDAKVLPMEFKIVPTLPLEDDRMNFSKLLHRFLSLSNPFDYAFFGRILYRIDDWSWHRAERKISDAVIRYEIDRFWWRQRRRLIAMHLRILFDMIETEPAPVDCPDSQYRGETEEPEEENAA